VYLIFHKKYLNIFETRYIYQRYLLVLESKVYVELYLFVLRFYHKLYILYLFCHLNWQGCFIDVSNLTTYLHQNVSQCLCSGSHDSKIFYSSIKLCISRKPVVFSNYHASAFWELLSFIHICQKINFLAFLSLKSSEFKNNVTFLLHKWPILNTHSTFQRWSILLSMNKCNGFSCWDLLTSIHTVEYTPDSLLFFNIVQFQLDSKQKQRD